MVDGNFLLGLNNRLRFHISHRMLLDNHGVLELLSAVTVGWGIHSSITEINFCCHADKEEFMASHKMSQQSQWACLPCQNHSSKLVFSVLQKVVENSKLPVLSQLRSGQSCWEEAHCCTQSAGKHQKAGQGQSISIWLPLKEVCVSSVTTWVKQKLYIQHVLKLGVATKTGRYKNKISYKYKTKRNYNIRLLKCRVYTIKI